MRIVRRGEWVAIALLFLAVKAGYAMDVTIAWEANGESNLAGYKIYYDIDSGVPYSPSSEDRAANNPEGPPLIVNKGVTEVTLSGLPEGKVYYLAVTAFDNEGRESDFSNEVATDTGPPTAVTNFSSSTDIETWSNERTVTVRWDPADDGPIGSGVAGYSIVWDNHPGTVPDTVKDIGPVTEASSGLLADGLNHYFHIRAVDNAGYWGEAAHLGPFYIYTGIPTTLNYPSVDYSNYTVDITYSQGNMQNALEKGNYSFSPSLNILGVTNPEGNTYRLSLSSIPNYVIFTLTLNNITDMAGNAVDPASIRINDNDNDQMADDWENDFDVDDPLADPDNDGFTNLQEFNGEGPLGSDPHSPDVEIDPPPGGGETEEGTDFSEEPGVNETDAENQSDETGPDQDLEDGGQGDVSGEEGEGVNDDDGSPAGLDEQDSEENSIDEETETNESAPDNNDNNQDNHTSPGDSDSETPLPEAPEVRIGDVTPHDNAGISDFTRVPSNTSFYLRVENDSGIDISDPGSIRFSINDGIHTYQRDLGDLPVVGVKKLADEDDTRVTRMWLAYRRSAEPHLGNYAFDTIVTIRVDVVDGNGELSPQGTYRFKIETRIEHLEAVLNSPDADRLDIADPALLDPELNYDAGIYVNRGNLKGAKVIYESTETVIPSLGPSDEIPFPDISGIKGVGVPMNLQPSTVFTAPVKVFIPCPGYADVSELSICFYNGKNWVLACDADGNVLPGGEGWMVPGSRVNHSGNPGAIEVKIYHFSAAQATAGDGSTPLVTVSGSGGGGGCFISTTAAGFSTQVSTQKAAIPLIIGLIVLLTALSMGRKHRRRAPSRTTG